MMMVMMLLLMIMMTVIMAMVIRAMTLIVLSTWVVLRPTYTRVCSDAGFRVNNF